jgi:hypothetical protein
MTEFIKAAYLYVRDDGLTSIFWAKRWIILRGRTITFHKSEVKPKSNTRQLTRPFQ